MNWTSGIDGDLAQELATVAGRTFHHLIALQRPWGEFRELIPQSIETLASRGRQAEQYAFAPKPKVFVSFDTMRTFKRVLNVTGAKEGDPLFKRFAQSCDRLAAYIAASIEHGVPAPEGIHRPDLRWFPDFTFGDVNDHSGFHELKRVPDIRHTAEGLHFLLEYAGRQLHSPVTGQTGGSCVCLTVLESLEGVVDDKTSDPRYNLINLPLMVVAHVLNLFRFVAEMPELPASLKDRVLRTRGKLATQMAKDTHYAKTGLWKTDSLGDVWGASYLLHLFSCKEIGEELPAAIWHTTIGKIEARFENGLVRPPHDDKIFETNIQGLLAVCERRAVQGELLTQQQIRRLAELVEKEGILRAESLEIGEACQLIQLALCIAEDQTVEAIMSHPSLHDNQAERVGVLVAALAEQLEYGYRSLPRRDQLADSGSAPVDNAYDAVLSDVMARCAMIHEELLALSEVWPILQAPLKQPTPGIFEVRRSLDFHCDLLKDVCRLLAVGWPSILTFPDLSSIEAARTTPRIVFPGSQLPRPTQSCIERVWTHALGDVNCRAIKGGLSGAQVFETESEGSLPRIIKCGSKSDILSEVNRYKMFVGTRLAGAPSMFGPVHFGHTYSVAYENAISRDRNLKAEYTANAYVRGRTLEELLLYGLGQSGANRKDVLGLYFNSLEKALHCLCQWKGRQHMGRRRMFGFGGQHDAFFRFPFSEGELNDLFKEAATRQATFPGVGDLWERVKTQLAENEAETQGMNCDWTIHGDFHARNVYVVLSMRAGISESVPKAFIYDHAKSVASVVMIDFANVTEGESRCLDFGKYLRDLRARSLSRALNALTGVEDNDRINALQRILAGKKETVPGLESGTFLKALEGTAQRLDSHMSWKRKALLYYELLFMYRLSKRWFDSWDTDAVMDYFGGWASRELALTANLYGISWALDFVEGKGVWRMRT